MNVLMIGNDSSVKGGITSVISQLLNHDWTKENIEIQFVPTYITGNPILKVLFFLKAYKKISYILTYHKPDIVHMHMSYRGSFTRKSIIHYLCMKKGVPDIIHLHGSEFQKWYLESSEKKKRKIGSMLSRCSTMIVLGSEWNERIKSIEPKTNTTVVNNTVSIPQKITSWNEDIFTVLFLGVLIKRKGVSDLLDSIDILKKEDKLKNIRFLIAGTGEEEHVLKQKAEQAGLSECVKFLGWISGKEKDNLLKSSQLLVLPSYNEGLPIAVLEAISYGLPVVATEVGDMATAVVNGYNGVLFTPGDIREMATAIHKIHNKEVFNEFSLNSRLLAQKEFSDNKYFLTLANLYDQVSEKNMERKSYE